VPREAAIGRRGRAISQANQRQKAEDGASAPSPAERRRSRRLDLKEGNPATQTRERRQPLSCLG
jgi:hypothetical protein